MVCNPASTGQVGAASRTSARHLQPRLQALCVEVVPTGRPTDFLGISEVSQADVAVKGLDVSVEDQRIEVDDPLGLHAPSGSSPGCSDEARSKSSVQNVAWDQIERPTKESNEVQNQSQLRAVEELGSGCRTSVGRAHSAEPKKNPYAEYKASERVPEHHTPGSRDQCNVQTSGSDLHLCDGGGGRSPPAAHQPAQKFMNGQTSEHEGVQTI
mmetsp:Transcript_2369/g.9310  ORF Transcript_2369/g.9310 Transcript_2369/m.9310 type:complete len:212 (-) Transcript_2369:452-1087(-)